MSGNDQKAVVVFREYESQEKVRRLQQELQWVKNEQVSEQVLPVVQVPSDVQVPEQVPPVAQVPVQVPPVVQVQPEVHEDSKVRY